jgi:hypothetical protein
LLDLEELKLLSPQSPFQATFGDNSKFTVTDITVGQLLTMLNERFSQGEAKTRILWQCEHAATHHKNSIAQRVDRALLRSVYAQSRQIASIRVNIFGPLPGDQPCAVENNHPTMQAACAFMLPLVQAYCGGKINDKKDLKEKALQTNGRCFETNPGPDMIALRSKATGNKSGCRENASGSEDPFSNEHNSQASEDHDNNNSQCRRHRELQCERSRGGRRVRGSA